MVGQRLKEARLEAGLSQRQLCGEVITRNMLSQIESGKARPSMQTLQYLAQMLQKPVSWFLDELPEQPPADPAPEQARKHYREGDYQQCLEVLDTCGQDNEAEFWLLRALCQMELARQAVAEHKDHYARSLLEKTALAGKHTPYYTPQMERERLLLLYQCDPDRAGELILGIPRDDRELLLRAQNCLLKGAFADAVTILNAASEQNDNWHYLYGQALMGQQQYRQAAEHFLAAEEAKPMACAKALETCYREMEDYKMAYRYACKQRQI